MLLNSLSLSVAAILILRFELTLSAADRGSLVLRGGQLFDSVKAELQPVGAVVIEGERIKALVPPGQRVSFLVAPA